MSTSLRYSDTAVRGAGAAGGAIAESEEAIARLDRIIAKLAQKDETARRPMSIPGFGPITASAMAATIQDTSSFAGPREFAAFLGLTPKQNSSGGKPKLGRASPAC